MATTPTYLCKTKQGQLSCIESVSYESQLGQMEAVLLDFFKCNPCWHLRRHNTSSCHRMHIEKHPSMQVERRSAMTLHGPPNPSRNLGKRLWYNTAPLWCHLQDRDDAVGGSKRQKYKEITEILPSAQFLWLLRIIRVISSHSACWSHVNFMMLQMPRGGHLLSSNMDI